MKLSESSEIEYASAIASATLSYILLAGVVISFIVVLAGIITLTVLRGELFTSIVDAILYVFLPLTLVITVYSWNRSRSIKDKALEFYKMASILAEEYGLKHGELIEAPAPPYTIVYRVNRKYLVVRRLDGYASITILEPIQGVTRKEYLPAIFWREKEQLLWKKIDGLKIKISKIDASIPDPKYRVMVEGEFLAFTHYTVFNIARIVKTVAKMLEKKGIELYEETLELKPGSGVDAQ